VAEGVSNPIAASTVASTSAVTPPLAGNSSPAVTPQLATIPSNDLQPSPSVEKNSALAERFTQLGQTGDLFGGVNALFAALALIGVFWAATMQWRSLSEGRRAAAEQRFSTVFFELLRLTREVLDLIEHAPALKRVDGPQPTAKTGASALNALANRHFSNFFVEDGADVKAFYLQKLVNEFKDGIYRRNPSALGPYFRLLFQTFDLVANAPLEARKRVQYSNIARGQISEGAVLLLALNALTWRGRKFVPLIEKFGLLEHMHQRYLKNFGLHLRVAFREVAFQGSEMRARSPLQPEPSPGPNSFDKDPSSPDFEITAPMTVPPDGV